MGRTSRGQYQQQTQQQSDSSDATTTPGGISYKATHLYDECS